jgi:serine/threonine protein kinase
MARSLFPEYRQKQKEQQENDLVADGETRHRHDNDGVSSEPSVSQQIHDITLEYLTQMEADSTFFEGSTIQASTGRCIPQMDPQEVELGKALGMGEFGVLLEVTKIQLMSLRQSDDEQLLESHRFAASSVNLPAAAGTVSGAAIQDTSPVTPVASFTLAGGHIPGSPTASDMSHSITLAKLARPTPLSIEQRTGAQQRFTDLLARSTARSLDPTQAQVLREKLAAQVLGRTENVGDKHATNSGTTPIHKRRLALKQVRKDLYPKKKMEAAKDLAREAKFLARLHHPNIICLRGVVSQPGRLEFGLLLDRLGMTLSEEIVQWHHRQEEIVAAHRTPVVTPMLEAFSSLFQQQATIQGENQMSKGQSNQQNQRYTRQTLWLLGERLLALWDIARGMQYLHSHKILFRDLKTENVGTLLADEDDVLQAQKYQRMQIFDFGLAKECKAANRVAGIGDMPPQNGQCPTDIDFYTTFHMTGLTGTLRIMAPEVIQCLPYGLSVDVYSFGVCLWEAFSGTKDNSLTAAEICKGSRPTVPGMDRNSGAGMPSTLQSLLTRCWAQDPSERPSFAEIGQFLHQELVELLKRQEAMPPSRHGSQSSTRNNSRSSSPLGRNSACNDRQHAERLNKVAAQAAFWRRLETIHSSSTMLDETA